MKNIYALIVLIIYLLSYSYSFADISEFKVDKSETSEKVNLSISILDSAKDKPLTNLRIELKNTNFSINDGLSQAVYTIKSKTTVIGRKKVVSYYHTYNIAIDKKSVGKINGEYEWIITGTSSNQKITKSGGFSSFTYVDLISPSLEIFNQNYQVVNNLGTLYYPQTPENLIIIQATDNDTAIPKVSAVIVGNDGSVYELSGSHLGSNKYKLIGFSYLKDNVIYTVRVIASDDSGNQTAKSFIFTYAKDVEAPIVHFYNKQKELISNLGSITYPNNPLDNFYFLVTDNKDKNPQVQLYFSKSGDNRVLINANCVTNQEGKVCTANLSDEQIRSLANNTNYRFDVIASDTYQNISSNSLSFVYHDDIEPPEINYLSSNNNLLSKDINLVWPQTIENEIKVKIYDKLDLNPQIKIYFDNREISYIKGSDHLYFLEKIPEPANGTHNVKTTVCDNRKNCVTKEQVISYSRDNTPPIIKIYNNANEVINNKKQNLSYPNNFYTSFYFEVNDNRDEKLTTSSFLDGEEIAISCNSSECIFSSLDHKFLHDTDHVIMIVSSDQNGNKATEKFSFHYLDDINAPNIYFINKQTGEDFGSSKLLLKYPNLLTDMMQFKVTDDYDLDLESIKVSLFLHTSLSNNSNKASSLDSNSTYDADEFNYANIAIKEVSTTRNNNGDIEKLFELNIVNNLYEKLIHNNDYVLEVIVSDHRGNLTTKALSIHYVYDDLAPRINIFKINNITSDTNHNNITEDNYDQKFSFTEIKDNTVDIGKVSWPNKFEDQIFFSVNDNLDQNPQIQVFLNNDKVSYICHDTRCFIIHDKELKNNKNYEVSIVSEDHYNNQAIKKIFFTYDCDENPPLLDFVDHNLNSINSSLLVHWPEKLSDQIKIMVSDDRTNDPNVSVNVISSSTSNPFNLTLDIESESKDEIYQSGNNCNIDSAESSLNHDKKDGNYCNEIANKNLVGKVKKINFSSVPLINNGIYTIQATAYDEKGNSSAKELSFTYIEDDEKPRFSFFYESSIPSDSLKKIYGLGPLNFAVTDNRASIVKIKALLKDEENNRDELLGIISTEENLFHLEQPLTINFIEGKTYELTISGEDDYGNISQHQIELYYQNKKEVKDDIQLPLIDTEVLDPNFNHSYDLGLLYTFAGNELSKNAYIYLSMDSTQEGAFKVNGRLLEKGKTIRFLSRDLFYGNHGYLDFASTDHTSTDVDYMITIRTSEDTPDFTFKVSFYKPQIILSGPNEATRIQDDITITPSINNKLCELTLDHSKALQTSPNNPICLLRYTFIPSDLKLSNLDLKGRLSTPGENRIEASLLWIQGSDEYLLSSFKKIIETSDIEKISSNLVVNKDEILAKITNVNINVKTDEKFCTSTFSDDVAKLNNFSTSVPKCLIKWTNYPQEFDWNDDDNGLTGLFLKEGTFRFSWEVYVFTSEDNKTLVSENYEDIKVINAPKPMVSFSSSYDSIKVKDTTKNENLIRNNTKTSYQVYIPSKEYNDSIFLGTLKIIAPVNQVIVSYDGKDELINLKNGVGELKIYQNTLSLYQDALRTFKVYYPEITDEQSMSFLDLLIYSVPDLNLRVYIDTLKEVTNEKSINVKTTIDKATRGVFDKNKYGDWEIALFIKKDQIISKDNNTNFDEKNLIRNNTDVNTTSNKDSNPNANNSFVSNEVIIGEYRTVNDFGIAEFLIDTANINFSQDQVKVYARARLKTPYPNYQKEIISEGSVIKFVHLEAIYGDIKINRIEGFEPLTVLFLFSTLDQKLKKSVGSINWQLRLCDLSNSYCEKNQEKEIDSNNEILDKSSIVTVNDEDKEWTNLTNETKNFSLSRKFNSGIYQIRVKTSNQYSRKVAYSKPITITVYRRTMIEVSSPKNSYVGDSITIKANTYFKNENPNFSKQLEGNLNTIVSRNDNTLLKQNISSDIILEYSLDYGKSWQIVTNNKINFIAKEKGIRTVYLRSYDSYANNNKGDAATIKKVTVNIVEHKAPNILLTGPSYLEPNKEALIYSKISPYYQSIEQEKCIEKLGLSHDVNYISDNNISEQIEACLNKFISDQYQGYFEINLQKFYGDVLRYKPSAEDVTKGITKICYVSYLATNSDISHRYCKRFKVHDYVFPKFKLISTRYVSYAPSKITFYVKPELYSLEELKAKTNIKFSWNLEGKGISYSCSSDRSSCTIRTDQAGELIVNVLVSDEFNHSVTVSKKIVLANPPQILCSINIKADNPYFRAPLGIILTNSIEGGHPNDFVKNIEYLVDDEIVSSGENSYKVILNEGIHIIKVRIKTELGYEVYDQEIIEIFKNQLPLCKIKSEEDDINYRFKAQCTDKDGRIKSYRWYIDDKLSKVTAWQIAIAKNNYKGGLVPKVSLEAVDDAGGISLKINSN